MGVYKAADGRALNQELNSNHQLSLPVLTKWTCRPIKCLGFCAPTICFLFFSKPSLSSTLSRPFVSRQTLMLYRKHPHDPLQHSKSGAVNCRAQSYHPIKRLRPIQSPFLNTIVVDNTKSTGLLFAPSMVSAEVHVFGIHGYVCVFCVAPVRR